MHVSVKGPISVHRCSSIRSMLFICDVWGALLLLQQEHGVTPSISPACTCQAFPTFPEI